MTEQIAKIIISDTHFGVRNNSQLWLESQIKYFEKQIIPLLKTLKKSYKEVRIYHLGDLFDNRANINIFTYFKVKELLEKLSKHAKMYMIAGNHDYYSPNYSPGFMQNSIDLFEDGLFVKVTGSIYHIPDSNEYLVPWFIFNEESLFVEYVESIPEGSILYTHTDLPNLQRWQAKDIRKYTVFSGHIHNPMFKDNLYSVGSCYPLTFADDVTKKRGHYLLINEDLSSIKFFENNTSIHFHRLYNEDIFSFKSFTDNDYIEFYIDSDNITIPKYSSQIKKLNDSYNCNPVIILDSSKDSTANTDIDINLENFNIDGMCKELVPKHLTEKLKKIL